MRPEATRPRDDSAYLIDEAAERPDVTVERNEVLVAFLAHVPAFEVEFVLDDLWAGILDCARPGRRSRCIVNVLEY